MKAPVLKTGRPARASWGRIPPPPLQVRPGHSLPQRPGTWDSERTLENTFIHSWEERLASPCSCRRDHRRRRDPLRPRPEMRRLRRPRGLLLRGDAFPTGRRSSNERDAPVAPERARSPCGAVSPCRQRIGSTVGNTGARSWPVDELAPFRRLFVHDLDLIQTYGAGSRRRRCSTRR